MLFFVEINRLLNMTKKILIVFCLVVSPPLFSQEQVLLKEGGVTVTTEDVDRYILSNTPKKDREALLAKKGTIRGIIESIYTYRSLEKEAENAPSIDWKQLAWNNNLQKSRAATIALLQAKEAVVLDGVDWEPIAKEAYRAEIERFKTAEMVSASHVLVKLEGRTHKEAKARINKVRERALAGEDFELLVAEYSEDHSAQNNKGHLGFFKRGQMVKAFEEAAFSMKKVGEISEVIESKFGFHLLKFEGRKSASTRTFEQVKESIIANLKQAKATQIRKDEFVRLRSEAARHLDSELFEQYKRERLSGK